MSSRHGAGRTLRRLLTLALLALGVAACEPEAPEVDAIPRETFIATWVDLRSSVMRAGPGGITPAERTRIIERHGVTEDDLIGFAEAHGADVAYMKAVGDEVESELQDRGVPVDSAGRPGGDAAP